jgi:hypothetical protein
MWLVVGAVVASVAIAVAVVGLALGSDDGPSSTEDYEAAVLNARDRTDFALGRLSRAQSVEELLERMDEAAAAIDGAAGDLADETPPAEFEDETDGLVKHLEVLGQDIQATADQARVPGYEELIFSGGGFDFESWDEINATLAKLRKQGIVVPPLSRHATS